MSLDYHTKCLQEQSLYAISLLKLTHASDMIYLYLLLSFYQFFDYLK
jgi:hypothetical protein